MASVTTAGSVRGRNRMRTLTLSFTRVPTLDPVGEGTSLAARAQPLSVSGAVAERSRRTVMVNRPVASVWGPATKTSPFEKATLA